MLLAEANQWPDDVRPYFGNGDECHMAFHFPLMPRIFMALRLEDVEPIVEIMRRTPPIPDTCQWALFLRNHDELTLEMVTTDERDYMYLAYGQDPRMKLNVGIRRRLMPLVENSRRRMELLNSLLFSFPGTPVVYYGDEIGMGDNIYLHDRNGVRTPMQWTPDRNAGFSRADPSRLYSAPISDPVYGYQAVNVEGQLARSVVAPPLDAEHHRAAEALQGVRARHDGVPVGREPQGARVRPPLGGGRHPLRRERLPLRTAGGARPVGVRGVRARGDARVHGVPADRAAPLLPHPRPVRLLLVRAAEATWRRRALDSAAMAAHLVAFLLRLVLSAGALWLAIAWVSPGNLANGFGRAVLVSIVLSIAYYVTLAKFLWFLVLPWLLYVAIWLTVIMGAYGLGFWRALLVALVLTLLSWLVSAVLGVRTFRAG